MKQIYIRIKAKSGREALAEFPVKHWDRWSPAKRCLQIHEQCRHRTEGQPFTIISTRVKSI